MSDNENVNIHVSFMEIPKGKRMMLPEMHDKDEVNDILTICKMMENNGIYQLTDPQTFESSTGCRILTSQMETLMEDYKSHFAIIGGNAEIGDFEEEAVNCLLDERFANEHLIQDNLFDLYFEEGVIKIKS